MGADICPNSLAVCTGCNARKDLWCRHHVTIAIEGNLLVYGDSGEFALSENAGFSCPRSGIDSQLGLRCLQEVNVVLLISVIIAYNISLFLAIAPLCTVSP